MPQLWVRNAVAEAIGTFVLTFVAVLTFATGELTGYAMAQGLTILALVAALGHVSGGHFNPAVTLAFLLGRRIDVVGASIYWAAQLVGGIVAAVTVLLVLNRDAVANGVPVPATDGDLNTIGAILIEAIAVFMVVLVILGTIVDHRAPVSAYPFAIGLAYAAGIFAIGGLSGAALNPARAFGPAIVGGEWEGIASWLIGPLLGAVLAWLVFDYVIDRSADEPELDDQIEESVEAAQPVAVAVAAGPDGRGETTERTTEQGTARAADRAGDRAEERAEEPVASSAAASADSVKPAGPDAPAMAAAPTGQEQPKRERPAQSTAQQGPANQGRPKQEHQQSEQEHQPPKQEQSKQEQQQSKQPPPPPPAG